MEKTDLEPPKTDKAKEKEEAKRLKLEKFKQKQAKKAEAAKSTKQPKESSITKLINLNETIDLENVASGCMKNVHAELPNTYVPRQVEHSWYSYWEKNGFFKPEYNQTEAKIRNQNLELQTKKFVMALPPPNVTGTLHIGHALTCAIQDCITRWNRMRGLTTLWVPGSDHAGIATQVVVEKKIHKELGKTRHDLGREDFLKEVWKWKNEKGDFIFDQIRRLGCSVDWDRTTFTLDPRSLKATHEGFKRLFKKGLIFRSQRLVNWSCKLKSAISDIEVEHEELVGRKTLQVPGYDKRIEFGIFETFEYEIIDEGRGALEPIRVSTTRLETMLGDVAVAVNPQDPRYTSYIGRNAKHPFVERKIKIIADEKVDMATGTGAVKITPAHDFEDYEKGLRHKLNFINIFTDEGYIVAGYGKFSGMKRFDARFAIRAELKSIGSYVGEPESRAMTVPICSRSKDIIEPRMKEQWFMNCKDLARRAVEACDSGELAIPKTHIPKWKRWLDTDNIRDWCISRQLWWGIRIPAYKAFKKGSPDFEWVAGVDFEDAKKEACLALGCTEVDLVLEQDEDVLDTWFSSGMIPLSYFGWPDSTDDMKNYYPTQLLETGEDIIFFWVARMVMLGLAFTDQLPFKEVFLHSIVRDADGRKMSKSLGNVIDPLDVISGTTLQQLNNTLAESNLDQKEIARAVEGQKKLFPNGIPECGTDALRFKLCEYCTGSGDIHLRIDQLVGDRILCNKIWQACKFIFLTLGENFKISYLHLDSSQMSREEERVLRQLLSTIDEANQGLISYNFRRATVACRSFWREELCSTFIEHTKKLRNEGSLEKRSKEVLFVCMDYGLRLLHPLMPYMTEELYQRAMHKFSSDQIMPSICVSLYPTSDQLKNLFKGRIQV